MNGWVSETKIENGLSSKNPKDSQKAEKSVWVEQKTVCLR